MINQHGNSRGTFALIFIVATILTGHIFAAVRADAQQDRQNQTYPTGSAMAGYSTADTADPSEPCKGMLRSLGSSMLAYAAINNHWRYGNFDDIRLAGFTNENFDSENTVDGWDIGLFRDERHHEFAIVAVPDDLSGDAFLIDSRQVLMQITPVSAETPGIDFTPSITRIERASSRGTLKTFNFVEFEPSGDPVKEFMLLLTPSRERYLLTLTAPYINMDEQFGDFIPEYVYMGLNQTFYVLEPVDEIGFFPMDLEPPPD